MATKRTNKLTAQAQAVPQSRDECAALIRRIGDAQREHGRVLAELNAIIAAAAAKAQPLLTEIDLQIRAMQAAVQAWCEPHRHELTDGGKCKTVNLITGEIAWRTKQPRCVLPRSKDSMAELLQAMDDAGLARYVRVTKEVNKDAILDTHSAARHASQDDPQHDRLHAELARLTALPGLRIVTGEEDFSVTPFGLDVAPGGTVAAAAVTPAALEHAS